MLNTAFFNSALGQFVKEVQVLGSYGPQHCSGTQYIYADGMAGLAILHTGSPAYFNTETASPVFLFGQTVNALPFQYEGPFRMLVFSMAPYIVHELFGIDLSEITDSCLDFSLIDRAATEQFLDCLCEEECIRLVSDYFLACQRKKSRQSDKKIGQACNQILSSHGQIELADLRKDLFMSPRNFERQFLQQVGVTAGTYRRISRFRYACALLQSGQFRSLTDLAYQSGYCDQAHFIRQFRSFTNNSPSSFLNNIAH